MAEKGKGTKTKKVKAEVRDEKVATPVEKQVVAAKLVDGEEKVKEADIKIDMETGVIDLGKTAFEGQGEYKFQEKEAQPSVTVIEEAINAVETNLDFDTTEEENVEEKIEAELEPIKEIAEEVKEIEERKERLEEALGATPEKAEELIKEELKKAEEVKEKIEKIISKPKVRNSNVTSWWNGMGYDF